MAVSSMPAPLEAAEGPVISPLIRHRGLARQALRLRRTQLGLGVVVLLAAFCVVINLAADLAVAFATPRLRTALR